MARLLKPSLKECLEDLVQVARGVLKIWPSKSGLETIEEVDMMKGQSL